MKKLVQYMLALFAVVAIGALATSCSDNSTDPEGHTAAINITTKKLVPDATGSSGESGTTQAFIGTVVTAEGFNLDQVTAVLLGGMECEIVEQTISKLQFTVPALELAQSDTPYRQDLLVMQGEQAIFTYEYYVTVPVTDAIVTGYSPAQGTVGTTIKIEGRNLEQLSEIRFGNETVRSDKFTAVVAGSQNSSVSFVVPAGSYAAGESDVVISAIWGGSNTIDVTAEAPFKMQTPKLDAYEQGEGVNAVIGDEFKLTGQFIDFLSNFKWGSYELIVLEQTATEVTLKFPSSIEPTDPVVATADVTAEWGTPAQSLKLVAGMRLDTTPQGPAKPVFGELVAEEGCYLAKTVVVKGQNMASIEGFVVGGLEAKLAGEPNDVEAAFIIPEEVTFTTATEVSLEAVYGGGTKIDFGTIKVYPFYYFKGVRLGLGSNSKSTYTQYASENSFFYPDLGRVVGASEWLDSQLDPYAASGSNAAVKAANTLTKSAISEAEYYAVKPYIFFITNSKSELGIAGCANSNSQIKTHCTYDGSAFTSLPGAYGTPIVMYRVLGDDKEWAEKVKSGQLESIAAYDGSVPGQGKPNMGAECADGKTWVEGSVIVVGYTSYTSGAKPAALTDLAKIGFIHIKEVTCADANGAAVASREGYIEFDFYWSKTINQ